MLHQTAGCRVSGGTNLELKLADLWTLWPAGPFKLL